MNNTVNHDSTDLLETFFEVLDGAWQTISAAYEISSDMPELQSLLTCTDLMDASKAAEQIVINMLIEVMEEAGRFTPQYKMPARSFGLASLRDPVKEKVSWVLAPEALQKWQKTLAPLRAEIEHKSGLIEAMLLIEELAHRIKPNEPCITAGCNCSPKRIIRLKENVLLEHEIVCDVCHTPYLPLGV